jgi:hypothetical protein
VRLRAELHCYLCGEVSGTWEWLATSGPRQGILRALQDDGPHPEVQFRHVRCPRCGGPLYLDAVEPVRAPVSIPAENFRAHRGRPRKQEQRLVG